MGTEEDTFNKLKKPTYSQMRLIWINSALFKSAAFATHSYPVQLEINAFFESYGWSVSEYSGMATR